MKRLFLVLLFWLGIIGAAWSAGAEEMNKADELIAAANAGNPEAQYIWGSVLTEQTEKPDKVALGVSFLERAAKQGHIHAMHSLAIMIRHGEVPGKTKKDAFNWYRLASEAGFAGSQNNLGDMYETGDGVPVSYGDAIHWYTRSALQGEPTAYWSLGLCYLNGYGVGRDPVEAYRWLILAVKQFKNAPSNRSKAEKDMKELEKSMTPKQIADGLKLADKFVPLTQTEDTIGDPRPEKNTSNAKSQ